MRKVLEKKIIIAIYSGIIPGSVFIENLVRLVATKSVKVLIFGKGKNIDYRNKNITVYKTPENFFKKSIFIIYQLLFLLIIRPQRLIKLIKKYKYIPKSSSIIDMLSKILPVINHLPDIFHIQWAKSLPYWFFLKEIFGVKIILSLRGSHINYSPIADKNLAKKYKYFFPNIDYMHAVSKTIGSKAMLYGADQNRIKIIFSCLNHDLIKNYYKSETIIHKPYRLLTVGRFHWIKGYHYSLTAIYNLIKKNIPIEYTIISNNLPSEEFLFQISDLSLHDNVVVLNLSSQEEVYNKMIESDCFLLPSIEEGISNAVIESMSIGLPVISSDCGGMREVINHGENGFLFKSRDVISLEKVLLMVMNLNNQERGDIISSAQENILKNYNSNIIKNEFHNLYNMTMGVKN